MKIIQVMPFFGLGGAEIMCENLVYELQKMGHDVTVVSLYTRETVITERLGKAGIDVRFLGKKDGLDCSMFKKLKDIFAESCPDVVHTHLYTTKYVFPVADSLGIKAVHTVHSIAKEENGWLTRQFNKLYFKRRRAVPVALSERVRETIADEYGLGKGSIPIAYNGVDLGKCIPKRNYSCDDVFRIVHVGSFYEPKNHKGLLEAFSLFHGKRPKSELWLIGEGEKLEESKDYVSENGLKGCVRFLGSKDSVYPWICEADVFTLPSVYEGIPMSLIEAMGTGLPIVATRVGGIPDMLDDRSALLVSKDPMAIAEAFEQYYLSEDLRRRHGMKALERSAEFSSEVMAEKYTEIYRNAKRE